MYIEACVTSFEEAQLAQARGAHRIELCYDLEVDGLTPREEDVMQCCRQLTIPTTAMVRCRPGNFCYTDQEVYDMVHTIRLFKTWGVSGIVSGALKEDRTVDEVKTQILADAAYPLPFTFHKAIDDTPDILDAMITLQNIKSVNRILTSGGMPSAIEGGQVIRQMVEMSEPHLTIIAAGGVTDKNLGQVKAITGAEEFHGRRIVGELIV